MVLLALTSLQWRWRSGEPGGRAEDRTHDAVRAALGSRLKKGQRSALKQISRCWLLHEEAPTKQTEAPEGQNALERPRGQAWPSRLVAFWGSDRLCANPQRYHRHYLILGHFISLQRNLPLAVTLFPSPQPLTASHKPTFCLYRFAYSGHFYSARYFQGSCVLQHASEFHSFLWLNNILL